MHRTMSHDKEPSGWNVNSAKAETPCPKHTLMILVYTRFKKKISQQPLVSETGFQVSPISDSLPALKCLVISAYLKHTLHFFHASYHVICPFISWPSKSWALLPHPACPIRTLERVALNELDVPASQMPNGVALWLEVKNLRFSLHCVPLISKSRTAQEVIKPKKYFLEMFIRVYLSQWEATPGSEISTDRKMLPKSKRYWYGNIFRLHPSPWQINRFVIQLISLCRLLTCHTGAWVYLMLNFENDRRGIGRLIPRQGEPDL